MAEKEDRFFEEVIVPFNDEDESLEFINPVVVAEHFARITALNARLASQSEGGSSRLAELEADLKRENREIDKLRRKVFADNFNDVTRTAPKEIQDAFILSRADQEVLDQLTEHEDNKAYIEDEMDVVKAALDRIRSRMRLIEKTMDWAKQYLDYEKLLTRVEMQRNRS